MKFVILFLAVLLVPVLGMSTATLPYFNEMGVSDPLEIADIVLICTFRTYDNFDAAEICDALAPFNLIALGSVATALIGLVLVMLPLLTGLAAGWNRTLIAITFPPVAFISMALLAAATLGQAAILAGMSYLVPAYLIGTIWPYLIIVVGLGGLFVAMLVILNAFRMFKPGQTLIIGQKLTREMAPGLLRVVDDVARAVETKPPENVVVGLDPTFFATSARVALDKDAPPLKGRTMYLSLPLLRVMSRDEARAVIGHELAHFSGGDTFFSKRYAPAFSGLGLAREEITRDEQISLWALPVVIVIDYILDVFGRATGKISRARELRADQIGAGISSPMALSSGLAKLSVLSVVWDSELRETFERIARGRHSRNLSANFVATLRYDINRDEAVAFARSALDLHTSHPTDSHPPTRNRIVALGVDPDALLEPVTFVSSLYPADCILSGEDRMEPVERQLTDRFRHQIYRIVGRNTSAEAAALTEWCTLQAMLLAHIILADGRVEDSEIETAQREARSFDPAFDATAFREFCRHPEDVEPLDALIPRANALLTAAGVQRVLETLRKVAEADGAVDPAEAAILERLSQALTGRPDDVQGGDADAGTLAVIDPSRHAQPDDAAPASRRRRSRRG